MDLLAGQDDLEGPDEDEVGASEEHGGADLCHDPGLLTLLRSACLLVVGLASELGCDIGGRAEQLGDVGGFGALGALLGPQGEEGLALLLAQAHGGGGAQLVPADQVMGEAVEPGMVGSAEVRTVLVSHHRLPGVSEHRGPALQRAGRGRVRGMSRLGRAGACRRRR